MADVADGFGGAILARLTARSRVVTVAVEAMSFGAPVSVGDIVTCYAKLVSIGRTSMKIDVEVWTQHFRTAPNSGSPRGCSPTSRSTRRKPHPVKRG